ncbi:uncharacterized protein LOC119497753 isoform X7 [Sebastes umbrosus]|uniref:uncharacterized protein LOC119497753 isoform X7 n=1 Tax=Sebastes umbrosus TaxID=72105 RepID=UPI00189D4841|nr:uncharacterized protein LOC119497753 isoform X7 [Sebastes umbrosus]
MAEAARPSAVSSGVATMAEEKQHPSLIQRVETMASVIELLLETLEDLSNKELRRFKETLSKTHFDRRSKNLRWQLEMKDMQNTVFLMVLTDGQQSVEKTKEVLKTMKRPDLVQRLSDSSSGPKKKHSVDEHLSALIHKVATMRAVKELLMETLNDLSSEELTQFRWLLYFTFFQRNLPFISWSQLLKSTRTDLVKMMVQKMMEMYGHQSVEVTEEIFMDMNRTDLVQRLSEISSGPKEKHCVDEHWPALTQEVETMASVIELLLETLKDLSDEELERFKVVLRKTDFPRRYIPWWQLEITDMQDVVFLMVLTDGQQSVERTKEILKTMKRTDLVQRLSDSSSGPKKKHSDEHRPALIQKVATIAAVKNLLLKTLKHLSNEEIKKFNEFLQSIVSQKNLRDISLTFRLTSDRAAMVDQLVQTYGQQSVELTGEVLQKMNKTDLMQMLSKPSSGLKEKQSVDEHQPAVSETHDYRKTGPIFMKLGKLSWYRPKTQEKALSAEVVTTPSALTVVTEAVKQILLETLKDFSNEELKKFKRLLQFTFFKKSLPYFPFEVLNLANSANALMDLMVKTCGQQSVEVTWEVLMDMNRTDLVERLSEISSGLKEKHPSKPIQKEGTMTPVQEKLLETLKDLSDGELEKFKRVLQYIKMEKSLPIIPRRRMEMADRVGIVELMVQTYGQQSVEVTREVFKKIDRRDLVERLSDISSGSKEKQHPSLIQRVETMASVIELLLETLEDLSDEELERFKVVLRETYFVRRYIPWWHLEIKDMQDTVFLMVRTEGQRSVEKTKEVLKTMKRTDLVQRLSDSSSGPKKKHSDEHRPALIQKVATIAAVRYLLLKTLKHLSYEEIWKFNEFLQSIVSQKNLPDISSMFSFTSDRAETVDQLVQTYGQQSVELTREVLQKMNKTDLMQMLSKPSSGLKEKQSVDEHQPAVSERHDYRKTGRIFMKLGKLLWYGPKTQEKALSAEVVTTPSALTVVTEAVKQILLETLKDLSNEELKKFKRMLQFTFFKKSLPYIQWDVLYVADSADKLVDYMVKTYGQQSVETTREVLMEMNRTDLVERLSETSSGLKGPSRSLEPEAGGSVMQDSSDWTKLEPEVNSPDADESPTYSLQSEAGNFECGVSGLRWVCKQKVSFKYQFCSWEEPMQRMESIQYMAAGPLIDIKVIAGKLDEVYLPHWICIHDNPTLLDKFAVLHIDDCGDVVEKVSEVTSSHVKLSEPVFSLKAVLVEVGIWKINCNVLIYKSDTAFLTLHVYVIPRDPGLEQEMDERKLSNGYKVIHKPHPEKSLRMRDRFILTADSDDAEIIPENLKLRYESRIPNFFEVYIENPDSNFVLELKQKDEPQPVWTRTIRKDEYQSTVGPTQGEHFVDKHRRALIKRVNNINPILDHLQAEGVISQEDYDTICAIPITQDKMRRLYSGPLKAAGRDGKDVFYEILEENESYLVADLKRKES